MRWAFWRKPEPKHVGPRTVDWKPGDMAECVSGDFCHPAPSDPKPGDRLMVSRVRYGPGNDRRSKAFFLSFIGLGKWGYQATAFRKIVLTETGADRKVSLTRPLEPCSADPQGIAPAQSPREGA